MSVSRLLPLIALLIAGLNLTLGVTWWRIAIFLIAYVFVVAASMERQP